MRVMERLTTKSFTVDYWDAEGNHLQTCGYCNNTKAEVNTEEYADKNQPKELTHHLPITWEIGEMKQED